MRAARDGGRQVMLTAARVGGTLWFSALPERAGLFIPAGDEDIPFCALAAPLCVAGNG